MGNLVSQFLHSKKAASTSVGLPGRDHRSGDGGHGVQGLRDYKRLDSGLRSVADLTILTLKDEDLWGCYVLNRKVEDARKVVLESTSVKKSPFYKELKDSLRRHVSNLNNKELQVKLSEGVEKELKENLHGLFVPLTDEEENDVLHALLGGNRHEVLVMHEASNIEITRELLRCLSCGAWLNDEVINLYLELLKEREKRHPKWFLKCHFFNTFFYKKLISGRDGYDYKAVRRWTTQKKIGYDLIECDKIFVPIHKEVHWCLAIIDAKEEKFQYLDSFGGMDADVLRVLARYFTDEVKDKSDKSIDAIYWKQESVNDIPLQKNGWDCGMFMLKYIDFYSRGLSLSFGQDPMAVR